MRPILKRGKPNPRGQGVSANATQKGARLGGKVNESELLVNSVKSDKPKALTGLNQKGEWSANPLSTWITGTQRPPENRQNLTHPRYLCGTR
jgi:hypothetical protein